jgi:citrate lyase subunit beta/citryl-CoA lyase
MVSLVVPGSSERMLAKAREIDADELVIDLEDAVVPDRKPEALANAVQALAAGGFSARRVAVRCNPRGTPWAERELAALATAERRPDSVVVPKVESASDLACVTEPLRIQALIETAAGLANLGEILRASARLDAVVLGYADLAVSLGRTRVGAADLDCWLAIQDSVLVAARAANLHAIDGPYLTIDDAQGLRAAAARAAELGFDGKWAIHPSQLSPIREAFMPSDEEIAHARAVVDALEGSSSGAVTLNGAMVDEPVRLAALRTLERVR